MSATRQRSCGRDCALLMVSHWVYHSTVGCLAPASGPKVAQPMPLWHRKVMVRGEWQRPRASFRCSRRAEGAADGTDVPLRRWINILSAVLLNYGRPAAAFPRSVGAW